MIVRVKKAKQRLTIALIANAAGGKEAPIVVGKAAKPKLTPFIGQGLVIKREPDNPHDKFPLSVICEGDVVGQLPNSIAKNVSYFLSNDENVGFCEITGEKCNRAGGLGVEIPCQYKFYQ